MEDQNLSSAMEWISHTSGQLPVLLASLPVLDSRWKIPVLYILIRQGPSDFFAIRNAIGPITKTALKKALEELLQDGLLKRSQIQAETPDSSVPAPDAPLGAPKDTTSGLFSLSASGKAFAEVLVPLIEWSELYRKQKKEIPHYRKEEEPD